MRHQNDLYPTPYRYADIGVSIALRHIKRYGTSLDTGAGHGAWGQAIAKSNIPTYLTGIEIDNAIPRANGYDEWIHADYLTMQTDKYDLIIGNPPYKHAEQFVHKSLSALTKDGLLVYLLRLNFLEGQKRTKSLWEIHPPFLVSVCSKRPSFTDNGKTDMTAYAFFAWDKSKTRTTIVEWV